MHTKPITELQDLISNPAELEWLELKPWIDLSDARFRAATARHLAAIANYGGGYLVFGFNDDGTRCTELKDVRKLFGQDVISGIVAHYLQPNFQCEVTFETFAGVEHPIVWIPTHGTTPIISKADGPQDARGRREGIQGGLVYMRTPKPESVAIMTPAQWDKLILRCVLARRDEMVGMFSSLVSGGVGTVKADTPGWREKLTAWHRATQAAFQRVVASLEPELRVFMQANFVQFSYMIRRRNGSAIPSDQHVSSLHSVGNNAALHG